MTAPAKIYNTAEDAEAAAAELNRNDPDWGYRVMTDPKGSGRAIIHIFEDGEFIEVWS